MKLELSKLLYKLSYRLKQKALYLEMSYYVYKAEIKHEPVKYFKSLRTNDRGIGKSYVLIKLSLLYGLPIIVPTHMSEKYLNRMAKEKFNSNKQLDIIVANDRCRGRRINTALVEEGVDYRILNAIIYPMCKNIIGYDNGFYYKSEL